MEASNSNLASPPKTPLPKRPRIKIIRRSTQTQNASSMSQPRDQHPRDIDPPATLKKRRIESAETDNISRVQQQPDDSSPMAAKRIRLKLKVKNTSQESPRAIKRIKLRIVKGSPPLTPQNGQEEQQADSPPTATKKRTLNNKGPKSATSRKTRIKPVTSTTKNDAESLPSPPTSSSGGEETPIVTMTPPPTEVAEDPTWSPSVHGMKLRARAMPHTPTSPSPNRQVGKPRATTITRKRQRASTDDVEEEAQQPDEATIIMTNNTPGVPKDFKGGKQAMWWDPQKPNIAHHQFMVAPHRRTLKSFILPAEAEGHDVKFFAPDGAPTRTPSRGYTATWRIDVTDPRYETKSAAAVNDDDDDDDIKNADQMKPPVLCKRRYIFHVHGVGRVRRPPVNPIKTCRVTCRASPCKDPCAPLLPPEARVHEDDVQYYVAGDGPFDTPPWDARPACRMVWTIVGTEDGEETGKDATPAAKKRRLDAEV